MRTLRLFLFAALTTNVEGYLHTCQLPTTVTQLQFDPVTGTYVPVKEEDAAVLNNNDTNNTTRRLHEDEFSNAPQHDTPQRGLTSDETTRLSARYCDCFIEFGVEPFYCPAHLQYCGATSSAEAGCYNTPAHQEVASNALFVASACFCAVFAWILLSEPGKHARNCMMNTVAPKWNERLVSNLLQQFPERALHMMRLHLRHSTTEQQDQEWMLDANAVRRLMLDLDSPWSINKPEDGRRPIALKLKTCIYESSGENGTCRANNDDDDDNADDCAICYQDLIHGERIGVLTCGHTLHAACLKEWCIRRNTCPLCNANEIAEPQFQNDPRAIAADLRRNLRI